MSTTSNIEKAGRLYLTIMNELDSCDEDHRYHILRYLTNFLETEKFERYGKSDQYKTFTPPGEPNWVTPPAAPNWGKILPHQPTWTGDVTTGTIPTSPYAITSDYHE